MKFLRNLYFLALSAAVLVGCRQPETTAEQKNNAVETRSFPTEAQPKLQAVKLYLGAEEVVAEMALTQEQSSRGLMFRTNMAPNDGMIFAFPQPVRASFWMKNCPMPLTVAYIDPEGVIQEIHDMQPFNTNSIVAKSDNIQFALEMNQGWFAQKKIEPGTLIRTEHGSLKETFLSNR